MEIESDGMHRKNVRPCPRTSVLLSFLCNMLLSSNSKNGMNAIQQQRRRVSVFARLSPSPLPVTCSCSSLSFLPVFQRRRNWPLSTLRLDLSHLRPLFFPLPPKLLLSSSAERPRLRVSLTPLPLSPQVFYGSRLPREKRFGETRRRKMSFVSSAQSAIV